MSIKKTVILLLTVILLPLSANCDHEIKAQNNAYRHNNQGLMYLEENYYFGAIKEFQIAIDLSPNSQASAIYYVNLGKTYEKIGYHNLARPCFEKAISLNVLCFDYYLKLAENYKNLKILDERIKYYHLKTDSPLNEVLLGLLYIQKGDKSTGITILDDFCHKEQNLLITKGIKSYLDKITNEL